MKTLDTYSAETKGNLSNSQHFKVEHNAQMFKALSDTLYSNKVGSILRELLSNAYDTHITAGNLDVPIELKLPSSMDSTFSLRDYGTGLTEDEIFNVYTTFFKSTRRDSNDAIGGFGLGSKTPLAYVDQFVVKSYTNGVLNTYIVAKSPTGPTISKVSSMSTTEDNGLEISFAVLQKDIVDFINEANAFVPIFAYMNGIKVNCNKVGTVQEDKVIRLGQLVIFQDNVVEPKLGRSYYNSHFHISMGGVVYKIDPTKIKGYNVDYDSFISVASREWSILYDVPIGSVDVTVSRESLEYTSKTIEYIKQLIENAEKSYQKELIKHLNSIDSLEDRTQCYLSLVGVNSLTGNASNNRLKLNMHSSVRLSIPGSILKLYKLQNFASYRTKSNRFNKMLNAIREDVEIDEDNNSVFDYDSFYFKVCAAYTDKGYISTKGFGRDSNSYSSTHLNPLFKLLLDRIVSKYNNPGLHRHIHFVPISKIKVDTASDKRNLVYSLMEDFPTDNRNKSIFFLSDKAIKYLRIYLGKNFETYLKEFEFTLRECPVTLLPSSSRRKSEKAKTKKRDKFVKVENSNQYVGYYEITSPDLLGIHKDYRNSTLDAVSRRRCLTGIDSESEFHKVVQYNNLHKFVVKPNQKVYYIPTSGYKIIKATKAGIDIDSKKALITAYSLLYALGLTSTEDNTHAVVVLARGKDVIQELEESDTIKFINFEEFINDYAARIGKQEFKKLLANLEYANNYYHPEHNDFCRIRVRNMLTYMHSSQNMRNNRKFYTYLGEIIDTLGVSLNNSTRSFTDLWLNQRTYTCNRSFLEYVSVVVFGKNLFRGMDIRNKLNEPHLDHLNHLSKAFNNLLVRYWPFLAEVRALMHSNASYHSAYEAAKVYVEAISAHKTYDKVDFTELKSEIDKVKTIF